MSEKKTFHVREKILEEVVIMKRVVWKAAEFYSFICRGIPQDRSPISTAKLTEPLRRLIQLLKIYEEDVKLESSILSSLLLISLTKFCFCFCFLCVIFYKFLRFYWQDN